MAWKGNSFKFRVKDDPIKVLAMFLSTDIKNVKIFYSHTKFICTNETTIDDLKKRFEVTVDEEGEIGCYETYPFLPFKVRDKETNIEYDLSLCDFSSSDLEDLYYDKSIDQCDYEGEHECIGSIISLKPNFEEVD